jgi:streptomycin 6-kinase
VLKVNFPDAESEHEAEALAFWEGSGAVSLLAHDSARRALLLERCEPGVQLWNIENEESAYSISADVFRKLWQAAPTGQHFRALKDEARRWAQELPLRWERHGRPCPRRLLDEAVALSTELAQSQPELVLCHQDAHGGNVLSAGERWLVIDPKPLVGERAFDLASCLRDRRGTLLCSPHAESIVARRLDQFVGELGVDRARARGWGIVHALAWGLTEETVHADLLASAELLAAT